MLTTDAADAEELHQRPADVDKGYAASGTGQTPHRQQDTQGPLYQEKYLTLPRGDKKEVRDTRPTVNRILRDPYIKKNISLFLEETKKR